MIFGAPDLNGIFMIVARPRLVDVACEDPGDQGCVCIGDGDVDRRLPDATVKLE